MTPQRIAITGSSGLIGGALSAFLRRRGDSVVRVVRRHPVGRDEVRLPEPDASVDGLTSALRDVDAVVNLAGAGIGEHRWTPRYKAVLRASRLETTHTLARAMEGLDRPIRLVSGSAVGYYGSRGEEVLDERSPAGADFLAQLCVEWERTAVAVAADHSVAVARSGLVMSARGGAFAPLLTLGRLGLGGPLGSGDQWWSWISLRDHVRAMAWLVDQPDLTGPVDLVAPRASRQVDLAQALGRALRRPALLPAPRVALDIALGEISTQLLASTRVRPHVLTDSGFTWLDANQDQALDRVAAGLI